MDDAATSRDVTLALLAWSDAPSKGLRSTGGPEGFATLEFHSRANADGPDANLLFSAELVDGRPVIRVSTPG